MRGISKFVNYWPKNQERNTGCSWFEAVARRDGDAPTLDRIITDHVLPGTTIITDAWGGYNNVRHLNNGIYQQSTWVIVHAHEFVRSVHCAQGNSWRTTGYVC